MLYVTTITNLIYFFYIFPALLVDLKKFRKTTIKALISRILKMLIYLGLICINSSKNFLLNLIKIRFRNPVT